MNTGKLIDEMTDPAKFELLVSAILRKANPKYAPLVHTGINPEGKTIKSPLDGICFVKGANPPHLIAFHHTLTVEKNLERKWLYEKTTTSTPVGDVYKTIEFLNKQKIEQPNLLATLVLTSNKEPKANLICKVNQVGFKNKILIDIWTRSRIIDFLDSDPSGQWIKYQYFGNEPQLLSKDLLKEISKYNLSTLYNKLFSQKNSWTSRSSDNRIANQLKNNVNFLVGDSGTGKSITAYKILENHIKNNGFGIILSPETIAKANSLKSATITSLISYFQNLNYEFLEPFSYSSYSKPLMIVVEDINNSINPQRILEIVLSWREQSKNNQDFLNQNNWCLICPIWPEFIETLNLNVQKIAKNHTIYMNGFIKNEGIETVLLKAKLENHKISRQSATEISNVFEHDLLFISLYSFNDNPNPQKVIDDFINNSLKNISKNNNYYPLSAYHSALINLSKEYFNNRIFELSWEELKSNTKLSSGDLTLIGELANNRIIIRFLENGYTTRIVFRHDRVRDWALAKAFLEMFNENNIPENTLSEPFFAEIFGMAIANNESIENLLPLLAKNNPISLFFGLNELIRNKSSKIQYAVRSITELLQEKDFQTEAFENLRHEALYVLAQIDHKCVLKISDNIKDNTIWKNIARFRNGDILGGINICNIFGLGENVPWVHDQIYHGMNKNRANYLVKLKTILRNSSVDASIRVGAIRLAGHFSSESLVDAVYFSWLNDKNRTSNLGDYIWAFGKCCKTLSNKKYLKEVCDSWAKLSNKAIKPGLSSPRNNACSMAVRQAFNFWPPTSNVDFFITLASKEDLRWPITYMLHGVNDPKTVSFILNELVYYGERNENSIGYNMFCDNVVKFWEKSFQNNNPMKIEIRDSLLKIWKDNNKSKVLRKTSFILWNATSSIENLSELKNILPNDDLFDLALKNRIKLRDTEAIPHFMQKLLKWENSDYWLQFGRYMWSKQLSESLDHHFCLRREQSNLQWGEELLSDWITCELIRKFSTEESEQHLIRHWDHLQFSYPHIQSALFVASPKLERLIKETIQNSPDPHLIFKFVGVQLNFNAANNDFSHEKQVLAFKPYFRFFSEFDIEGLWYTCNRKKWYSLRKEILDPIVNWSKHKKWRTQDSIFVLDKISDSGKSLYFYLDINLFLEQGANWSDIFSEILSWFKKNPSQSKLRQILYTIVESGTRLDLCKLEKDLKIHTIKYYNIFLNMKYSLYRNSLV